MNGLVAAASNIEKQMLLYTLVIAIISAMTLSILLLQTSGVIISKNAKLTQDNSKAIEAINERIMKSQLGTTRSATYNLSLENNHLLNNILNNLTGAPVK